MDIKIKLLSKAFLFIGNFNLSRAQGDVNLSLNDKSDNFIKIIISNIACGACESDTDWKDLLPLIQDADIRKQTAFELGADIAEGDFEDTLYVEAEILEMVTDTGPVEISVEEEHEEVAEDQLPEELIIPEGVLGDLLKGTTKTTSKKLLSADLSDEDKAKLLVLEKEGKNRAAIIQLLS